MKHLKELADSGTSYVHLLPAFDIGTIPEKKSAQQKPACDLSVYAPDSEEQQACVAKAAANDGFNWGYDPLHYTVPEGSYASDPDGTGRTVEFRQMVQGLNGAGLRTVMDVVYNHTVASGQDDKSVLDRIVPGYYQRLLDDGTVATSTCCANTAPENTMMGKLVVDSIVTWAKEYKVDGFRFDLMGHHPKANILAVRKALDALTVAKDGVDGKKIILYGEGWNFGEIADDARFVQATQKNMAGTGVATFSDRARDAVRGGGPFDEDPGVQGFASGLYTDPNTSTANGTRAEQKARLLHYQDLIKVGLTGNLADYTFTDSSGRTVKGSGVDYNGAPAGYAAVPGDALAYADAHDNESLYDALAFKLPTATSAADRARMQVLAMATAALSQGPSLSQAGIGPAALQVPGPQLVRQRRLVQRTALGLPGRQRLRPRTSPGSRQRVQVVLCQAAADRRRAQPRLRADQRCVRRVPGPAHHPHDGEGVRPLHHGAGAVRPVVPALREGRDARRDHDAARRTGDRPQRDPRHRAPADRGAGREGLRPAPRPGRGGGFYCQEGLVREEFGKLHRPGTHGGRVLPEVIRTGLR